MNKCFGFIFLIVDLYLIITFHITLKMMRNGWVLMMFFLSYIYRESNVFEREIDYYRTGIDALNEAERITDEIRNIEHDLWHF